MTTRNIIASKTIASTELEMQDGMNMSYRQTQTAELYTADYGHGLHTFMRVTTYRNGQLTGMFEDGKMDSPTVKAIAAQFGITLPAD